jgi:uncharacterized protein GlcG (DUF336 family)
MAAPMAPQDTDSGDGTDASAAFTCTPPDQNDATTVPYLTVSDVCTAVTNAATAVNAPLVIAVSDRQGDILAVYRKANAPLTATGNYWGDIGQVDANEVAVALARTTSFFSNNEAPLTSHTVRFISGVHFPPGIMFTANADLYGIENTNRGCDFHVNFAPGQFIPRATAVFDLTKPGTGTLSDGTKPGLGILTGKKDIHDSDPNSVNTGGIPLFKVINGQNVIVGGIGVVGADMPTAEFAGAVAAISFPFTINPAPPGVVIVGGLALPEITQTSPPAGSTTGAMDGAYLPIPNIQGGSPIATPQASPNPAPEGDLIPETAGSLLSLSDVQNIVTQARTTANDIRGVIRLPLGSRSRMVIAVADVDGTLLALYRMQDATIFSIDVAVAKSRNVIYFTNNPVPDLPGYKPGIAVTNRTISFGAQPFFPPGIDYSDPAPNYPTPGPFFDLFKFDTANPCSQGVNVRNAGVPNPTVPATTPYPGGAAANGVNPFNSFNGNVSGIVFFPGAVPLYRNGVLVGGLGISGDGVDQDDFVTNGGAQGFLAPEAIRADNVFIRGVRMPYQKYPRNPEK